MWHAVACMKKQLMLFDRDIPRHDSEVLARESEIDQSRQIQHVAETLDQQRRFTSIKVVTVTRTGTLAGRPKITSTKAAVEFFRSYWETFPANDQEHFVVACLDTKHVPLGVYRITTGTLDASLVHPREVFKPAHIEGASAIILSHNHPSGDPTPSREDHQVTSQLTEAGKLFGITVLDHVIYGCGTGEAISIREC